MLAHDVRMALRSLRRTPYVSVMMIGALAVGIMASMIAITLYHARTGHPIPWKEHTLFAVALDPRDPDPAAQPSGPDDQNPPPQLTYQDAQALYTSDIPLRSVMMYKSSQVVTPEREGAKPFSADIRVTTFEFFKAFDSPFLFGSGWSRADDDAPAAAIVLSKFMNDRLFHGANSVGNPVVMGGHTYRVTGVLDSWLPRPKFYDMTNGPFEVTEDVYLPFGWMKAIKLETTGTTICVSKRASVASFDGLLTADCVWLQFWVEFRSPSDRDRYQQFLNNYTDDQRTNGRFPRKNNNRVADVSTWLARFNVVGDETRIMVVLGFVFLGLCILNTVGLLLSKFLTAAPIAGLRRALGASRVDHPPAPNRSGPGEFGGRLRRPAAHVRRSAGAESVAVRGRRRHAESGPGRDCQLVRAYGFLHGRSGDFAIAADRNIGGTLSGDSRGPLGARDLPQNSIKGVGSLS